MPWLSGRGILWWTIVQFAETTSWTFASSARQIKQVQQVKNVLLHGVFAIMPFIFIA
jgi:hypothetical protein